MKKPKVSVLVPIYNVEKYLPKCLDSLVNQTLEEIEIICLNDGSTDGSLAILEAYATKDDRLQIVNKPNTGYGHSMNLGLSLAKGEYVGILESDDYAELTMFEALYEVVKKYPTVDLVKGFHYEFRDCEEETVFQTVPEAYLNRPLDICKEQAPLWIKPCIWSAIYRNAFLHEHAIRFLETPGASYQDTAFAFQVNALSKEAVFINTPVLHYRLDSVGSSINSSAKVFCVCDEYNLIFSLIRQKKEIREALNGLEMRMKLGAYDWNFKRLAYPYNWQFLKRMSLEFQWDYLEKGFNKEHFDSISKKKFFRIMNHPLYFFIKHLWRNFKRRK